MKKVSLSLAVILAFLLYSWHDQQETAAVHVTPPQSLSNPGGDNPSSSDTQTPPPSSQPSTSSGPDATNNLSTSGYKDGEYIGDVADAFYGPIQVKAIIQNGKITDVQFLQYPNDRGTSVVINQQAMPYLTQEAIQAQSANVDIVSGATDSSEAFRQSLSSALSQAKS